MMYSMGQWSILLVQCNVSLGIVCVSDALYSVIICCQTKQGKVTHHRNTTQAQRDRVSS